MNKKAIREYFFYSCLFIFTVVVFILASSFSIEYNLKKVYLRAIELFALYCAIFYCIYIFINFRKLKIKPQCTIRTNSIWKLYLILVPVVVYYFQYSLSAYNSLFLENNDFTNISSVMNHTSKGLGILRSAYFETGSTGSYLGHHFSPELLFLVPFYYASNLISENLAQQLPFLFYFKTHFLYAILLGLIYILGLFLWIYYSIKQIGPKLTLATICFLLFLPVVLHLVASFHYELPVLPLSAFFFYQLKKRKIGVLFILSLFLFCIVKEDIALYLILFGMYQLSFKKSFKMGAFIVTFCAVYFLITKLILIPWFSDYQPVVWESYWTAPGLVQIPSRYMPSVMVLASTGLLIIIQFRYFFIVILPILIFHATSNHLFHQSFLGHYGYSIIPFLLFGIVEGIKRVKTIEVTLQLPVLKPVLGLSFVLLFYASSLDRLTPFPSYNNVNNSKIKNKKLHSLFFSIFPKGSCIYSQSNLSPHLPLHSTALPLFERKNNYYRYSIRDMIANQDKLHYKECSNVYVLLSNKLKHHVENQAIEYKDLEKLLEKNRIPVSNHGDFQIFTIHE